ncbi:hypothetical protein A3A14_03835 [Candidatus Daviesbacteria bacterium RIFCSPLOWO2_01_FULL_43_38]|uniref:DUF3800 domain-containing protein n=1 Tax=Candidatus Daviesbacteria bacterium RIFCSPHIGHO2_12_FULL_43_11 TaxID=1797780 RepID=A0A1F5K8M7_9BACT|nr:MAG: hypothetical protein A2874_00175 [Candidatus Daviesbacteria bacterium RIFCSPHIGHO2_01_FULL_43_17]OGE36991.1 MAG: hypothetical protein A3E45_01965 [Candidatus Daviesbacteria bacterium RIFCSPHIGHO2_12_FULL_43_11]OGE63941.1 MAG: hypothetical protein A3A14_03835 [Candidatus Daviesbacteria bacterium RIFCSPLOWO2_01_FULL_43_38]
MPNNKQPTTYIFIDESGKPEVFSAKGENLVTKGVASKFLVLCAIRCSNQLTLQQQVTDFRATLLKDSSLTKIFSAAYTLDSFHAQTDYPEVKERFYRFISTLDIKVDVIVIDKLKSYLTLQENPGRLYGVMAGQLLKNICHQAEETEIIFSRKDSKYKLRLELEVEAEQVRLGYIQQHPNLKPSLKVQYYHNPHYSHGGLQIADYVASAVYQVFERNNRQWYEIIKNKIGKIQDICNKKYFTRSNPL